MPGEFLRAGCVQQTSEQHFESPTPSLYRLKQAISWRRLAWLTRLHTCAGLRHPCGSRWKAVRVFSPRSPSSFSPCHTLRQFSKVKWRLASGCQQAFGPASQQPTRAPKQRETALGHGLEADKRTAPKSSSTPLPRFPIVTPIIVETLQFY